jgi:DNA-binding transcriptional regulator YiaG
MSMATEAIEVLPKRAQRAARAAEYKDLRERLGLTNVALARCLEVSLSAAQRYENNRQAIPGPVLKLLRMWVRHGIEE